MLLPCHAEQLHIAALLLLAGEERRLNIARRRQLPSPGRHFRHCSLAVRLAAAFAHVILFDAANHICP